MDCGKSIKPKVWMGLIAAAALSVPLSGAFAGEDGPSSPAPIAGPARPGWSFMMTTYGWLPWLSGDVGVRGRQFTVDMSPHDLLESLDWSTLPVWMSYAEARNGRLTLFNDTMYTKLTGSGSFARSRQGAVSTSTLIGNVEAEYEQATIELGAAYEAWAQRTIAGYTAVDVLAGGRYWHQDASLSADATLNASVIGGLEVRGSRVFARSGSVDWVDPFIGLRVRSEIAPGQALTIRGDIGGFGAGSDFSWQALATYNWQLCLQNGHAIDAYVGYRALSVDYSQSSGTSKYQYDVLQQGPVMGASVRF